MGDDDSTGEKARAVCVIGMIVRVDHVTHRAAKPPFDKIADTPCFLREDQGIDHDRAFGRDHGTCRYLRVHFTGADVEVVGETVTLHSYIASCQIFRWEAVHRAKYRFPAKRSQAL